jgi:DNA-binding CsgD family transcriptional regulator
VLSERERDVLTWAAVGMTSAEIGEKLHIAEKTVHTYLARSYTKLGARKLQQAIAIALNYRLIAI